MPYECRILNSEFILGPKVTVAVRRGFRLVCFVCGFDMTGLEMREALRHFFAEHGTGAVAEPARRDFPGVSIPSGKIGDTAGYSGWLLNSSC